jgi:hypothetical protein
VAGGKSGGYIDIEAGGKSGGYIDVKVGYTEWRDKEVT